VGTGRVVGHEPTVGFGFTGKSGSRATPDPTLPPIREDVTDPVHCVWFIDLLIIFPPIR
jgi:hypothetical protein